MTNKKDHPLYAVHRSIISRCTNPKDSAYKNYGGRGIAVCKRWLNFNNFIKDVGERPKGLTLDRINNDGDYEPSNCKWSSYKEQANNRRHPQKYLNNTSGFTGVSFHKGSGKFIANVHRGRKCYHVGYFETPSDARDARVMWLKENAIA